MFGGKGVKAAWAIGLFILLFFVALGCDRVTRHRVLTTIFDDVPPLEAKRDEPQPTAALAPGAATPTAAPAPPPWYMHRPFAERQCSRCHDAAYSNRLRVSPDKLCVQCHASIREPEEGHGLHGPVAAGACAFCHDPHQSRLPKILRKEVLPTCFGCHEEEAIRANTNHPRDEDLSCIRCHDPHHGRGRFLLKG